MPADLSSIAALVQQILSAPGTDFETISRRSVRKQLPELDDSLTPEFLKANKTEIYDIIAREFDRIIGVSEEEEEDEEAQEEEDADRRKRKHADSDEEEEDVKSEATSEGEAAPSPKKKAKKASPTKVENTLSDEALARQLSHVMNGRESRSTAARGGAKRKPAAGASTKAPKRNARSKKSALSAATIEDSDDDGSGPSVSKPKKTGGAKGGFSKELALSEPLARLLEVDKLSRPQVVKQLWVYIKANNLQDPSDKREILGDEKFKAVFRVERLNMMRMNKLLSDHLHEITPSDVKDE